MQACGYRPASATASSGSAATRSGRPWRATTCTLTGAGDVALQLRRPWSDGTTHLVFAPVAFLARLAVLVPRPRVNLVLYHGLLAPRAAWRAAVVPCPHRRWPNHRRTDTRPRDGRGWRWADLMRRVFAVDVLACPSCGGRLRLVAVLDASAATVRILQHLQAPDRSARASPGARVPGARQPDRLTLVS